MLVEHKYYNQGFIDQSDKKDGGRERAASPAIPSSIPCICGEGGGLDVLLRKSLMSQSHTGIPNPEHQNQEEEPDSIWQWNSVGIQSAWERREAARDPVTIFPGSSTTIVTIPAWGVHYSVLQLLGTPPCTQQDLCNTLFLEKCLVETQNWAVWFWNLSHSSPPCMHSLSFPLLVAPPCWAQPHKETGLLHRTETLGVHLPGRFLSWTQISTGLYYYSCMCVC